MTSVDRLHRLANLAIGKRRVTAKLELGGIPLHEGRSLNEVWSRNSVFDSLANGRRTKCPSITDDFNYESVEIAVDHDTWAYATF